MPDSLPGQEKIRPSEENIAIANFYLSNPPLNVALQNGGIQLGKVASHIVTNYFRFKIREELGESESFTEQELYWYRSFKLFVEKKLPVIAAQYGVLLTDKLIEAYIATTQARVILASGLKTEVGDIMKDISPPTDEKKEEPAPTK
jgi:hypothetical protein